jgi:hypothetical protein
MKMEGTCTVSDVNAAEADFATLESDEKRES